MFVFHSTRSFRFLLASCALLCSVAHSSPKAMHRRLTAPVARIEQHYSTGIEAVDSKMLRVGCPALPCRVTRAFCLSIQGYPSACYRNTQTGASTGLLHLQDQSDFCDELHEANEGVFQQTSSSRSHNYLQLARCLLTWMSFVFLYSSCRSHQSRRKDRSMYLAHENYVISFILRGNVALCFLFDADTGPGTFVSRTRYGRYWNDERWWNCCKPHWTIPDCEFVPIWSAFKTHFAIISNVLDL